MEFKKIETILSTSNGFLDHLAVAGDHTRVSPFPQIKIEIQVQNKYKYKDKFTEGPQSLYLQVVLKITQSGVLKDTDDIVHLKWFPGSHQGWPNSTNANTNSQMLFEYPQF